MMIDKGSYEARPLEPNDLLDLEDLNGHMPSASRICPEAGEAVNIKATRPSPWDKDKERPR